MKRDFFGKGLLQFWLLLGVVYAGVLAWHQPLREPLTEAEIQTAFGARLAMMETGDNPQASALLRFFRSDDGKPFYMINLNATPEPTPETETAAQTYGRFMLPRLIARASYPVLNAKIAPPIENAFGSDLYNADSLVVVRYRSRRDFMEIISTDAFRVAVTHKATSLDGWYTAPSKARPVIALPQIAFMLLFVIGVVRTVRNRTPFATDGSAGK